MTADDEAGHGASATSIDSATAFIAAQQDGPKRVLALHRRLGNGVCCGCLVRPTMWPCTVAAIALKAACTVPGTRQHLSE